MKGNNKLILNTSTMIEIVQRWVDVEMPNICKAQKVSRVSPNHRDGVEFEIYLTDKEATE